MKYYLTCDETGNKSKKYHYKVVDEFGNGISERRSNKKYVACTIGGRFYFSSLDSIGKGHHGEYLKICKKYHAEPPEIVCI